MIIERTRNTTRSKCLTPAHHGLPGVAEGLDREADEQRDEQRLQHRLADQRGHQRGRDDAEQELRRRLRLVAGGALDRRTRLLGDHEPGARVQEVPDHQPDDQGDGGHRDEVEECEPADLPDGCRLADGPDAQHDRAEDHRRDHHLDEVDERRADRAQRHAEVRPENADCDAGDHRHDHRDIEIVRPVRLALRRTLRGGWLGHAPSRRIDLLGGVAHAPGGSATPLASVNL
jgi:hypothetical protein